MPGASCEFNNRCRAEALNPVLVKKILIPQSVMLSVNVEKKKQPGTKGGIILEILLMNIK